MARTLVCLCVLAGVAAADTDPELLPAWAQEPALLEWSTSVRIDWGVTTRTSVDVARAITPPPRELTTGWGIAADADVSLPIANSFRIGAFGEARWLELFGGGELVITGAPANLDMFQYTGEGVLVVRGGGGRDH